MSVAEPEFRLSALASMVCSVALLYADTLFDASWVLLCFKHLNLLQVATNVKGSAKASARDGADDLEKGIDKTADATKKGVDKTAAGSKAAIESAKTNAPQGQRV